LDNDKSDEAIKFTAFDDEEDTDVEEEAAKE